jgi:tetratricopeptide (TPR) repeat protein
LTRVALAVMIVSLAGCASWSTPPPPRPSATLLAQADRLMTAGQYADALDAYEQILAKYPDAIEAARARINRDALTELLAARTRIGRLTASMKAQEVEIARMRDELARARAEITRLTADADRLRTDLEQLKRIDIDLERPRK